MPDTNSFARSLHDLGLAAWFGGSLMGAIGLNGAAAKASDPAERSRIATAGWTRWAPVNAVAIGAHLVGGAVIVKANKGRITGQANVASHTGVKAALTAAALAATAASGVFGTKVARGADAPTAGATEPSSGTPADVASAQRNLQVAQWAIPALTGAVLVMSARMGEQQRPGQVGAGLVKRLLPS
ncbi:MAG: hypothetical protein M3R71_02650 [Actinomycetota bacterium]|nr:hypothetical protein [Actinomycetota bacterium]